MYENNMYSELIDKTLDPDEYRVEDVKKCMEIGLLCTQSPVSSRPPMSQVVAMLLIGNTSEEPKLPTRSMPAESHNKIKDSTSMSNGFSIATVTSTSFTGR